MVSNYIEIEQRISLFAWLQCHLLAECLTFPFGMLPIYSIIWHFSYLVIVTLIN